MKKKQRKNKKQSIKQIIVVYVSMTASGWRQALHHRILAQTSTF